VKRLSTCLKALGGLFCVFVSVSSGFAQETCNLNVVLPEPQRIGVDWKNDRASTDHYALMLSWSPEHCKAHRKKPRHRFQCVDNYFGFVVHGLWPQSSKAKDKRGHPRHCKRANPLTPDLIRVHICTVPGVDLLQGEWAKHGTCAFATPAAYFQKIAELWTALHKPDMRLLQQQKNTEVMAGDIIKAFVKVNSVSVDLNSR
jgi:ribonuclease T2